MKLAVHENLLNLPIGKTSDEAVAMIWRIDTYSLYDTACLLAVLGCLFLVIAFASYVHDRRSIERAERETWARFSETEE